MSETPVGHAGIGFLREVGVALAAALVGGLSARALGLPVLVGYLLAGLAVGPHTPGLVADAATVASVADLGVALLMFAVGTQFSLAELRHVGRVAVVGGGFQIAVTTLLGTLLGIALGWGATAGLFLGCALTLSSTAVMLKVLEERGELGTSHGRAMLGILVMQDLAVVPMVVLLPALAAVGGADGAAWTGIGMALGKALLFLGGTVLMATRVAPALMDRVARTGSRELFLLTAMCLCLGAGYAADRMGLGLPLGAFLAGMVLSESGFAQEVLAQIRPLRDVFAALFFVSVGMLLDPGFVLERWPVVAAVVATILVGKPVATLAGLRLAGVGGRTATLASLGLAQIGEFSFVLATLGTAKGLVPPEVAGVILAAALLTILATPLVYGAVGRSRDDVSSRTGPPAPVRSPP